MVIKGEEVFVIDQFEDFDMLYVPLRSYLAKMNKGISNQLNNEAFINVLMERLYQKPLFDIKELHRRVHTILPELSIPLTTDCNLRCKYCYADAGEAGRTDCFPKDRIQVIIDAYFDFIKKHKSEYIIEKDNVIRIAFAGGGEPTSKPDLLEYAVELCKERASKIGCTCGFSMPTNLACNLDTIKYLAENFKWLSVSFDGPKDIQNYQRPFANGRGTFDTVFRNAKFLHEKDFHFAFRATVTEYSVHRLKEIVDFFNEYFPGHAVNFERMFEMGRSIRTGIKSPSRDEYNKAFKEVLDYGAKQGLFIRSATVGKLDTLRTVFCGAVGKPDWTVTLDGQVASCERNNMPEVFVFGKFDFDKHTFEIDDEKLKRIRDLNVFEYEECRDCFCKYNCAGDCPDLRSVGMLNCSLTKDLCAEYLKNKLEEKADGK